MGGVLTDDLQAHIDTLKAQGVSLRYAEPKLQMQWGSDRPCSPSVPVTVLYVVAFRLGKEPSRFATPKAVDGHCPPSPQGCHYHCRRSGHYLNRPR